MMRHFFRSGILAGENAPAAIIINPPKNNINPK